MNTLQDFEKNQIKNLTKEKQFPTFYPGDTVKIHLKIKEGEKERIQVFEGVCIAKKNAGLNSSFTVRKISYGEGVERVFPLYSPQINKIELSKSGSVRRSKLYYLRERSGKSARISEKNKFVGKQVYEKNNTDINKIGTDSEKKISDKKISEKTQQSSVQEKT